MVKQTAVSLLGMSDMQMDASPLAQLPLGNLAKIIIRNIQPYGQGMAITEPTWEKDVCVML